MRLSSKSSVTGKSLKTHLGFHPSKERDPTKASVVQDEHVPPTKTGWKVSRAGDGDTAMALFSDPNEVHELVDPVEARKLERKIDFMILPYLAVCYAFFYIDKTTLSYAAIFNIREDLNLVGTEYNWLSSIFYFGFLIWAFPTNFLMQRLPIGKYLGFNIFMWVTAKLLTQKQRRMAVERLRENQTGVENKHLKGYQVREAFMDYKLYLFFILGVVGNIPNGGISNFGTIIIRGFGFSTLVTTLMQVPYGIFICISILVCVFLNDRFKNRRCLFIILFLIPNICGSFSLRFTPVDQKVGRLISYYLTGPYNAAFVLVLSLQTANTAGMNVVPGKSGAFMVTNGTGHTKKVVTNAVLFLGYCTGNIAGPFFYKDDQSYDTPVPNPDPPYISSADMTLFLGRHTR
ncbi:MAG: hypothetical protein Q9222_001967 [Ikaeria aurantiellina]